MNQNEAKSLGTDVFERSYGRWWLMLLDGLCLIAISIFAFFFSNQAIPLLVFIFGIYRGIMGVIYIISGLIMRSKYGSAMGFTMGRGIFDLVVCAIFLLAPTVIVNLFIYLIGIMAIVTGIILLVVSASSNSVGRIVKIIFGVAMIAFGIFAFINPNSIANIIVMIVGALVAIVGVFLVVQSIAMKRTFTEIKKVKKGFEDYDIE